MFQCTVINSTVGLQQKIKISLVVAYPVERLLLNSFCRFLELRPLVLFCSPCYYIGDINLIAVKQIFGHSTFLWTVKGFPAKLLLPLIVISTFFRQSNKVRNVHSFFFRFHLLNVYVRPAVEIFN